MGYIVIIAVQWDLQRIVSLGAISLTVVALGVAIATCRRPGRVRLGFDLARLAVAILGVALMAAIVGISVDAGWILLAIGAGLLVGTGQGWFTKVSWKDGSAVVSKTAVGVAVWGVGVLVMQVAGVLARIGVEQLGQTISWFGAGVLAGMIVGRQVRLAETPPAARAKAVAGTAFAGLLVLTLGLAEDSGAGAQEDEWVLVDTTVNPAELSAPVNWDVTTTATGMTVVQSFGPADPSGAEATFEASWTPPPDRLTPGAPLSIPATVSGRNTGNLNTQYFFGVDVVLLVDGTWNNEAVGAGANCAQTTVISGVYVCTDPVTNRGEMQTTVPSSGESFSVGVTALNCSDACNVTWTYERSLTTATTEPTPTTPAPTSELSPATTLVPPTTAPDRDNSGSVALPPSDSGSEDIDSTSAVGQAIGGLIVAVAIGLISAAEAGVLISSITGRGPLSPDEATAEIDRIFTPAPPPESAEVVAPLPEPSEVVAPPPEPSPVVAPPPPEPPAPPAPDEEAEQTATARSDDPCGGLVVRYRDSLRRWMHVQRQIQNLENEYWALNEYVETGAEADFWGAAAYLATLGLDTYAGPSASSGQMNAMVSAFEQSLRRSVMAQALQAAAMGDEFDTDKVAEQALSDAVGFRSAEQGDPGQAAFGAFVKESLTALTTRLASSNILRTVKASVDSGVLNQAGGAHIAESVENSFSRQIGPMFGVMFKAWEVWKKNEEWAAGAHRRALIRNHMVGIDARINELEFDRGEIEILRNVDREQLARCRTENS